MQQLTVLTFDEIKAQYPDEWILVGDPELDNSEGTGSVAQRLLGGVILLHSKDRREIAYKAKIARKDYKSVALVYTGEIPKPRKYLL